jgi:hypothetical protein
MAKILRDDVNAAGVPEGGYGTGYTVLAWTRDGQHWVRDLTPFFEADPTPGAWDHTHAWIDDQLLEGDELRLYYGGYKNGHKFNRFVERQIGLVTMRRDRYVARRTGASGGTLKTVPLRISCGKITLNADIRGELRARIVDVAGAALPGFGFADATPIQGDSLSHELKWSKDISAIGNAPVSLEIQFKDGSIFSFDASNP